MGFLSNYGGGSRTTARFENLNGLPMAQSGGVQVSLLDDRVSFQSELGGPQAVIEYDRISNVTYTPAVDVSTYEVDKNPIVRGIIGNAIAGKQGAMIGAITGIGTKTVERKDKYFVLEIDYADSAGYPAVIRLRDGQPSSGKGRRLAQILRQMAGQGDMPDEIRL